MSRAEPAPSLAAGNGEHTTQSVVQLLAQVGRALTGGCLHLEQWLDELPLDPRRGVDQRPGLRESPLAIYHPVLEFDTPPQPGSRSGSRPPGLVWVGCSGHRS